MDIYSNLDFNDDEINELADAAKDWVILHGMIMRNNNDRKLLNFAPFMLFPSPFPKYLYEEAFSVPAVIIPITTPEFGIVLGNDVFLIVTSAVDWSYTQTYLVPEVPTILIVSTL